MSLLVKRNGKNYPGMVNDLLDTRSILSPFFGPDFLDFNMDYSMRIPSLNVIEKEDQYYIELAAPGLKKKDFKVEVDNNVLTISSEKEEETEEQNKMYKRKEFSYSNFVRSFQLPEEVMEDDIDASYEDGLLKITLPKKEKSKIKSKKEIMIS